MSLLEPQLARTVLERETALFACFPPDQAAGSSRAPASSTRRSQASSTRS